MKKKPIIMFLIVSALFVAFAQSSWAYTVSVGSDFGLYKSGQGGEFTFQADSALAAVLTGYDTDDEFTMTAGNPVTFQSFCLEKNEGIYVQKTYDAVLNNGAIRGGLDGATTDGKDRISIGTAWLYSQFAAGELEGYNYEGNRKATAGALQNTIWWLEDELTTNPDNIFSQAVIAMFGGVNSAKANSYGAYDVRVLNLTKNGVNYQDQLVVSSVPLPSAIWLFGAGLMGLIGVSRRRLQN